MVINDIDSLKIQFRWDSALSSFKEIEAIYNFDMELKGLFYPIVMLVETALKIGLSIQ